MGNKEVEEEGKGEALRLGRGDRGDIRWCVRSGQVEGGRGSEATLHGLRN